MNRAILRIFLFLILVIFIVPVTESNSFPVPGKSEFSYQLFYYFDLRDRDSYIQVTNNDNASVNLHIQIFQTNNFCNENDFFDEYTQDDTHIYNMSNIMSNDSNPTGVVLPVNAYGFVAITVMDGVGGLSVNNPVLSGNFRIVDDNGYEYRSVAASYPVIDTTSTVNVFGFNFSPAGTNTFADVIGIAVDNTGAGSPNVEAFGVDATFNLAIFNQNEIVESCVPETFSCASNIGLNSVISNSKGAIETLCSATPFNEGHMRLNLSTSTADFFVGFIGLNNGTNRGGMEIFTSLLP